MEAKESAVEAQIVGTAETMIENGIGAMIEATEKQRDESQVGGTLGTGGTTGAVDLIEMEEIALTAEIRGTTETVAEIDVMTGVTAADGMVLPWMQELETSEQAPQMSEAPGKLKKTTTETIDLSVTPEEVQCALARKSLRRYLRNRCKQQRRIVH